jgi:hypothetical protein
MANKISVLIDVTVDKAVNSLKSFRTSIAEADGVVNKFKAGGKAAFDGIKANAGAMAVGAIGSVVAFSGTIIKAGAEMEAMDAKAETVFGDSLGRVTNWADTNAKAMGLTSREAINAGASIADLLKPMGFTEQAATDNSIALLELSGALSAWSGGTRTAAEVSQIFTKAMLGEREELKSLGISISEADVQARLSAKGQEKLTGASLAQAKALATQELIYEKSTDAQKAWADGSMDGVKAQNEAKSAVTRLTEVLNESLYPVLVDLVPVIAATAEGLVPMVKGLSDTVKFAGDAASKLSGVDMSALELQMSLEALKDEFIAAGAEDTYEDLLEKTVFQHTNLDEITRALADAQRANIDLTDKQANAALSYNENATIAGLVTDDLGGSFESVDRSARDFAEEVAKADRKVEDLERALRDADAALSTLKGNIDQNEAWRNMNGAVGDLLATMADPEASVDDLAASFDDARLAVANYIEAADQIPPEVKTQLYAELDEGKLQQVNDQVRLWSNGIDLPVTPRLLPVIGSGATYTVDGDAIGQKMGARAKGGPVSAGGAYLVGEEGPEILQMGSTSGNIIPNHKLGSASGAGNTYNIFTNADPNSTIAATRRFGRRNGPGLS